MGCWKKPPFLVWRKASRLMVGSGESCNKVLKDAPVQKRSLLWGKMDRGGKGVERMEKGDNGSWGNSSVQLLSRVQLCDWMDRSTPAAEVSGIFKRVLRAGTLGWPRGMGWGGRWEGSSRWGNTCTPMEDSSQCMAKPIQYCKVK